MPPNFYHRRSIRLKTFDYRSPRGYFITLSTPNHADTFGIRRGEEIQLNPIGEMVEFHIQLLPNQFSVELDAWMLMPNHLHLILFLENDVSPQKDSQGFDILKGTMPCSVGAIVQSFKSVTTRKANRMRHSPETPLWQRNYYERIVRNEKELDNIRQYILENPVKHANEDLQDF